MLKKVYVVNVGIVISGILIGCTLNNTLQNSMMNQPVEMLKSEPVEEVTEIRIAWWGTQIRHEMTQEVIEMFMEQYPNIKIRGEYTDFSTYWEKLATQSASKTLPDIIQQDYKYIGQYAEKGIIAPLDPYITNGDIDISDIPLSIMEASTINDEVYGICLGMNTQVIAYRSDIVEEAGVVLSPFMTWEEYEEICRIIYEETGVYSAQVYGGDVLRGIELFVRNAGETLYAQDNASLGFDDPLLVQNYYEVIKRQMDIGVGLPLEFQQPGQESAFLEGLSWNNWLWSNQVAYGEDIPDKYVDVIMVPQASDHVRNSHYLKPSMFFSVTETSEEKEAAVQFIDYFTNSIEANQVLLGERGIPVSLKVRQEIEKDLTETGKKIFRYVSEVEQYAYAIDPPEPRGAGELTTVSTHLLDQILDGQITPQQAAEEFMGKANLILSENY